MYLKQREEMQKHQEAHFRQLNKLTLDFKLVKNDLVQAQQLWTGNLDKYRALFVEQVEELQQKIS